MLSPHSSFRFPASSVLWLSFHFPFPPLSGFVFKRNPFTAVFIGIEAESEGSYLILPLPRHLSLGLLRPLQPCPAVRFWTCPRGSDTRSEGGPASHFPDHLQRVWFGVSSFPPVCFFICEIETRTVRTAHNWRSHWHVREPRTMGNAVCPSSIGDISSAVPISVWEGEFPLEDK